ncbi:diguanylate cyclase domain-containing protein [Psychromonas aquimarina]|uniref:diguanylate cyclase domain-containing protein n=1 Tax=Psychromonas aquimarina TaxID=444919 RepID=UPI00040082E7|nr:diguanylate cyclase [Psychromonas aquimarina]
MNSRKKMPPPVEQEPSLQPLSRSSRGRRCSLAAVISSAFICIVFLFISAMTLSHYRLLGFQSILTGITEDSFPEITYSRNLHNQINELLHLSSRLAYAANDVTLRMAKQSIDNKVQSIQKQINEQDGNVYLGTQLNVISNEFSSLQLLVKQKLAVQEQIIEAQNTMYVLHEKMFRLSPQVNKNSAGTTWTSAYSEMITLASKTLIKLRLQEVRQIYRQIENKIFLLEKDIISLPQSSRTSAESLTAQLRLLLFAENGLLQLKIEQLRINGRVIGREHFVKNLLDDFSRVAEFKSYQINEAVIADTNSITEKASAETKLMNAASLLVLFVLFAVIYFIKRRFVERVVLLNNHVIARLKGDKVEFDVSGNDEISDMAEAFNFFAAKVEEQKKILRDLSLTDGLTGLFNRRALDQRLDQELQSAVRNQLPVAVLIMDIDYFKRYNDIYGHLAGDDCLKQVSAALLRCKRRSTDFIARYGGEEFLFILPNTTPDGAQKMAAEVLAEVNALNIPHEGNRAAPHITMSIGIAGSCYQENLNSAELLKKADEALYKAKKSGKNCIYSS